MAAELRNYFLQQETSKLILEPLSKKATKTDFKIYDINGLTVANINKLRIDNESQNLVKNFWNGLLEVSSEDTYMSVYDRIQALHTKINK
jgi:hypothetical protein